jgi:hypothetical protein
MLVGTLFERRSQGLRPFARLGSKVCAEGKRDSPEGEGFATTGGFVL